MNCVQFVPTYKNLLKSNCHFCTFHVPNIWALTYKINEIFLFFKKIKNKMNRVYVLTNLTTFSSINCHLHSLRQSVECSLFGRYSNQDWQLRLGIVEHHRLQLSSHSIVQQYVTFATVFHPSPMFLLDLCGFVSSTSDDNWKYTGKK